MRTPRRAHRVGGRWGKGFAGLVAGLLLLPGFPTLPAAAQEPPDPASGVAVRDGLLTVNIQEVPLAEVLREIEEQAGLKISIRGTLDTRITRSFVDLPLDEGIQRLVRGHALGVSFSFAREQSGGEVLTDVWITGSSAASPPGRPARAAVDPQNRASQLRTIRELTRQRDPAAVATLAQMLAEGADPLVRSRAAAALASVGGRDAAGALTTALADPAASVRMQAARAIGRLDPDSAAQVLQPILLGDPDARVRRAVATTLGTLRHEGAQQALEAAREDSDPSVRRAVTRALARWQRQRR